MGRLDSLRLDVGPDQLGAFVTAAWYRRRSNSVETGERQVSAVTLTEALRKIADFEDELDAIAADQDRLALQVRDAESKLVRS
jgi:hypothetical protein